MSKLKFALIPAACFLIYSTHVYLDGSNARACTKSFQEFTEIMFRNEVTSSTLNLHYTLVHPENYGIENSPVTYGNAEEISLVSSGTPSIDDYRKALYSISREDLSSANQLTYDILSLYLENEKSGEAYALYAEPLGATIGIQAQLPILLSEYAFYTPEDVDIYLELLSQTDSYFSSLLEFEQKKSREGLFMSDTNADGIISQCSAFMGEDPEDNLLVTLFNEKITELSFLSSAEKESLKAKNLTVVKEHVLPAYQLLAAGLRELKGTGKNENGLSYFPDGKAYYEYLLRSQTGSYLPVTGMEKRIRFQLQEDLSKCRQLLLKNPALTQTDCFSGLTEDPVEILENLREQMQADFPAPPAVSCDVKYVHECLEEFLSPAFYLTPPIDNLTEHVIYINRASGYSPLELYTTLAHEGYPGHLYQNIISDEDLSPVRSLLSFGGYTEGWATYVEMESYRYAAGLASGSSSGAVTTGEAASDAAEFYRLNRSVMLGISSLLDICIHYHGFTREDTTEFLKNLGFVNPDSANAIFDAIIESPANYLKYYVGYLSFLDLRTYCQKTYGDQFNLKEFHQQVLAIGPCPFPVLEKYIKAWYEP